MQYWPSHASIPCLPAHLTDCVSLCITYTSIVQAVSAPSTTRRRAVTRDEVIAAALHILDTEGLDGLTMANVAKRVGFTTMAVYRHVKNREDLIAGAVEA